MQARNRRQETEIHRDTMMEKDGKGDRKESRMNNI